MKVKTIIKVIPWIIIAVLGHLIVTTADMLLALIAILTRVFRSIMTTVLEWVVPTELEERLMGKPGETKTIVNMTCNELYKSFIDFMYPEDEDED